MNRIGAKFFAVALVAAITGGAAVMWISREATPVETLAAAANSLEYRVVEGRLSGGFDYKPMQPVTRGLGGREGAGEMAMITAVATVPTTDLRAAAISHLLLRNASSAAETLDTTLRQQTQREDSAHAIAACTDVRLLTDFAAAHHALGRQHNQPRALMLAAEAAARAWRLERTPETAWNRALTIEALYLREPAAKAWTQYLQIDSVSPWAREVRARIRKLATPTTADLWDQEELRLLHAVQSGDRREIARIVRAFPGHARMMAENETLPEWASCEGGSGTGSRRLAFCRAVAGVLHETSGESMLYDTIRAIDAASPTQRAAIVRGLTLYSAARVDYHALKMDDAGELFRQAYDELRRARIPFAAMARMYLVNCERYHSDTRAIAMSDEWLRERSLDEQRYQSLAGQHHWVRGVTLLRMGRAQASIQEYQRALEIFAKLGERDFVTAIHGRLAESYGYVGDREEAWRHRFATLEQLGSSGNQQPHLIEMMTPIATAALDENMPAAAVLFLDRQVAASAALESFAMGFQALLWRSIARADLGDGASELADVREARAVAPRIHDPDVRALALHTPEVVKDRVSQTKDFRVRQQILETAIAFAKERKLGFRLSQLYLQLGHEHMRVKRWDAAQAALFASVGALEHQLEEISGEDPRGAFLTSRLHVYDTLAGLLAARGKYAEAFDVVERSRARTLLDHFASDLPRVGEPLPVETIQRSLSPGVALIQYARAGGRMGVWVVSSTDLRFFGIDLEESDLHRLVDRFRIALQGRNESAALDASRAVHDALVRPWYQSVQQFEQLVILADGPLAGVPFATLNDRESGKYLVERHAIVSSPSANVYAACTDRDRQRAHGGPALVVAPATSASSAGNDVLLSASRTEIAEVARHYPSAMVLEGPLATRREFLTRISDASVIHFAGHTGGRLSAVPTIMFAADGSGSNALHVEDIRAMRLTAAKTVVLAACESGTVRPSAGTQGTSSLARAFLAAGAPAVIASYWNVEDAASARFSALLHAHLACGVDAASALRSTQLQLLASADARDRKLGSWGAFALVGGTSMSQERRQPCAASIRQTRKQ